MRSSTRQAIACIFVIFSGAVLAHAQTTPVKEPGATITGRVTVKGKGVAGVIVGLVLNERKSRREYTGPKAVTDDDGNYRIVNVPPGEWRVVPIARTFIPTDDADRQRVLVISKDETVEHMDFAMVRGGVITGRVVDAEGRPMVEEWVQIFNAADNSNVYQPNNSSTDDRGVYRIYGVRPGSYRVAAGRGEDSFQSGPPRPYRRTYHPSVNEPSQATVVEVTEGGETKDVDITFTSRVTTYKATGRLVDGETGQPVPGASYGITRYEERGTSSMGWGAVTNARGEFKLENLSPGKYSVSLSPEADGDWRVDDTRFEVVDHDVTDLVIKTIKSGTAAGVVVLEGLDDKAAREQFKSMMVSAWIEGRPGDQRSASSKINDDGSFKIRGLASGTAMFYLHSNGSVRINHVERDGVIQPRGILVKEREHINGLRLVAQFGNATLRGKIEVENGTLPADARFSVWPRRIGEDPANMMSSNIRPQVDTRGQFVIEGLIPGTYELEPGVYLPSAKLGYLGKKQQVVVTANTTTTVNITIDLNSASIIRQ